MLLRRIVADARRVAIFFRYREDLVERLRAVRAAWIPHLRAWALPRDEAAQAFASIFDDDAERREVFSALERALAKPDPEAIAPYLSVQVYPLPGGRTAVASLYDVALARALKRSGGRWRPDLKVWILPAPVDDALSIIRQDGGVPPGCAYVHNRVVPWEALAGLVVRDEAPKIDAGPDAPAASSPLSGWKPQPEEELPQALVSPIRRHPVDESALGSVAQRLSLYPYQIDGVRHLASASSALLADDMGLGKTRTAIAAALVASTLKPVLVVCPASLRLNWAREIAAADASPVVILGESGDAKNARWVISSYERLGGLAQDETLDFGAMIVDEAHYIKEHDSARTKNAIALAGRTPFRMLLTGTPVLNRETELHALLAIGGHPLGGIPLPRFRALFAGHAAARALLRERVGEWMLRRTKDEVMRWLPGKTEFRIPIEPPSGFIDAYQAEKHRKAPVLGKISRLRAIVEDAKVDFIAEKVAQIAPSEKCIVFCEFLDTVSTLVDALAADGIRAVSLVGEDDLADRQAAVDAFQNDSATRVFVSTTRAGGVGINLTAGTSVFFASLPWTPALKRQAEDRANRNGQTRPVTIYIPYIPGTIDEDVMRLIEHKAGIEADLMDEESARKTVARSLECAPA